MVISNKVINKKYIKDYVKSKLWQLHVSILKSILDENEVIYKSSLRKDELIELVKKVKSIDWWEVYQENKGACFGLTCDEIEDLLSIDTHTRKKMKKNNVLKVAYYNEVKISGFKTDVPLYDLEVLYNMTKAELEIYKEKYKKKEASKKQLEALEKARAKAKENLTCVICGGERSRYEIVDRLCTYCNDKYSFRQNQNKVIEVIDDIKRNQDNFLICHMETTGLYDSSEICNISIIDLKGNILLDTLIKVTNMDEGARYAHGITKEKAQSKGIEKDIVYKKLKEISKDKIMLMWNTSFLLSKFKNTLYGQIINEDPWRWDYEGREEEYEKLKELYKDEIKDRENKFKKDFTIRCAHDIYCDYFGIDEYEYWSSVHRLHSNEVTITFKEGTTALYGCKNLVNWIWEERQLNEISKEWLDRKESYKDVYYW